MTVNRDEGFADVVADLRRRRLTSGSLPGRRTPVARNSRGQSADRSTCSTRSDPTTWRNPGSAVRRAGPAARAARIRRAAGHELDPVVTFLQVSADMAVAIDVPDGHGHRYA